LGACFCRPFSFYCPLVWEVFSGPSSTHSLKQHGTVLARLEAFFHLFFFVRWYSRYRLLLCVYSPGWPSTWQCLFQKWLIANTNQSKNRSHRNLLLNQRKKKMERAETKKKRGLCSGSRSKRRTLKKTNIFLSALCFCWWCE
jgi:hypothetical protein